MPRLFPHLMALALPLLPVLLILPMAPALAAEEDPHAADRAALIQVFHAMEEAINAQDVERMIAQMTPDATVTWLNGETSRGPEAIRTYYLRMVKGPDRYIDKYTTAAKIGAHAHFFGGVAVADGSMRDTFHPVSQAPFSLDSRWSSVSVKVNGQWKVAALHLSANVFTNDLMEEAKSTIWKVGIGAALAGLLLGLLVGLLVAWLRRAS